MSADAERWIPYDFAVIHVVPHPHLGTCSPVGVVLHAPPAAYIGMRIISAPESLANRFHDVDPHLLGRYLRALEAICTGVPDAGPIALLSPSERFHWLTAPRSDVIACGPVHSGLCLDPGTTLAELYQTYVATSTS